MNIPEKPGTLCFSPMPDLGYDDPLGAILRGDKTHTIRTRPVRSAYREVTIGRGRTGVIIEITSCKPMKQAEFLTDSFAQADGLRDANALATCLRRFYEKVPETMWRIDFKVARAPEQRVAKATTSAQEVMDI